MSVLNVKIDYIKLAQWVKSAKWCIKAHKDVEALDCLGRIEKHLDKAVQDGKRPKKRVA
ncbi:MAG: hypothetical protein KJ880_01135 [Candidatus Omnitrophica bacterium]|nr:hypothetical protein [Candidatus Omnitrophota bacterium]